MAEPRFQLDSRPAFVGIPTFMKLPLAETKEALAEYQPDVAIVGAPFDIAVTYRPGARFGPRAIRQACYLTGRGVHHLALEVEPFKRLTVVDAGDALTIPSDMERSHQGIYDKVLEVVQAGAIPIILGGDHSITFPAASAVADHHGPGSFGIIHFDAHADTANDAWGVLLSHGTPMRRLIENGKVPGKNFVQVGLRGFWPPPDIIQWMHEQGLRWHLMEEVRQRGFEAVLESAIAEALDGPGKVYLSVDIDVLDPAFAPGTGTAEPGGLSARELLWAVRDIALRLELVGMDVVEVAPPYDHAEITAQNAHRLVLEAISAIAVRKGAAPPAK